MAIDRLLEGVPGFGRCIVGRCRYVDAGSAAICSACAGRSMVGLAPADERCEVCDHPFAPGEDACGNALCGGYGRRWFGWNYAIAMKSGQLEQVIWAYKAGRNQAAWASIFGRVLVGFLEQKATVFREFDLIVASPTWLGEGGRSFDHIREILRAADRESGGLWPFDVADDEPPAVIRTAAVPSMRSAKTYQDRKAIAQGPLRAALHVPRPSVLNGRRVLVFDDVFTDGQTLNEVARAITERGGAASVCGVTLARQRYGQSRG